jgi:hypothetical protein
MAFHSLLPCECHHITDIRSPGKIFYGLQRLDIYLYITGHGDYVPEQWWCPRARLGVLSQSTLRGRGRGTGEGEGEGEGFGHAKT